jgi:ATP-dependent Clp protease adapter protein ClpS
LTFINLNGKMLASKMGGETMALADASTRVRTHVVFDKNWNVICYNDDTTPEVLVIFVFTEFFKYDMGEAFRLCKHIESNDSAIVATLPKKLAEKRMNKALDFIHNQGFSDFKMDLEEEK